jgi:hypothetical protein
VLTPERGFDGGIQVPGWQIRDLRRIVPGYFDSEPSVVETFYPGDLHYRHLDALVGALESEWQEPSWGWGDSGTQELAFFLDVAANELIDAIGWRWDRNTDNRVQDEDRAWYVAGDPRQVLLGLGPDDLVVGTPTLTGCMTGTQGIVF